MKITQEMYNLIRNSANSAEFEIGGILGGTESDTVFDVVLDIPSKDSVCRFTYTPDVQFLNNKILQWQKEGEMFLGIFHTHFSGCCDLSVTDREYIEKIMQTMPAAVKHLYFPIFTLPDQILNIYAAKAENGITVIEKDEAVII